MLARDELVELLELLGGHLGDGLDRLVVGADGHHDLEQTRQTLGKQWREGLLVLLSLAELVGYGSHLASRSRRGQQELGDLVVVRLVELGLVARP